MTLPFRSLALLAALKQVCREAGYQELVVGRNWSDVPANNSIMAGPAQPGTPLWAALRAANIPMGCGNGDVPIGFVFNSRFKRYDNAYLEFRGQDIDLGFGVYTLDDE